MNKKTLLFYVHISGHKRAAESIQKAFSEYFPHIEGHCLEALSFAYPVVGRVISKVYLELLKRTPQLWDMLYDNKKVVKATKEIRLILNIFNSMKFHKLIKNHNPDCLVCTQAIPCSILAASKRNGSIALPLIGVITDYAVHSYWIYKEVDAYLVANDAVKREMIKRGVKESKIYATGIPIDPKFNKRYSKNDERQRLGLRQNQKTVLVMGGSMGMIAMNVIIKTLIELPISLQVLAATGLNKKLNRELKEEFADNNRVSVHGYTAQIYRLMASSDLLISKPGGLTTSEALSQGLPMLIFQPIPGQEDRNSRFLISRGSAIKADTISELKKYSFNLLTGGSQLNEMSQRCLEIARPNSAHVAAEIISNIIG